MSIFFSHRMFSESLLPPLSFKEINWSRFFSFSNPFWWKLVNLGGKRRAVIWRNPIHSLVYNHGSNPKSVKYATRNYPCQTSLVKEMKNHQFFSVYIRNPTKIHHISWKIWLAVLWDCILKMFCVVFQSKY